MKTTIFSITSFLILLLMLPSPALAKKKGGGGGAQPPGLRITEVSAVSITVEAGKSGDEHLTYKITDATKVTLNGAPAFARDLRAGMMAKITATPDHSTALTVEASDPPAHPERGHVG